MRKLQRNNIIDTLYREHVNTLFSYALHLGFDRETCKDAIHDVFYKLCMDQIKLDSIKNMRFYLLRALKNRLLDIHKQKKEYTELSSETINNELPFTIDVTIEDKLIQSEEYQQTQTHIENILKTLSNRQREVIYLRYSQECDYEEIAQLMNISVHSCRKLLHKGISKLKMSTFPLSLLLSLLFFKDINDLPKSNQDHTIATTVPTLVYEPYTNIDQTHNLFKQ